MALISTRNLILPFKSKVNLWTIFFISLAFVIFRIQGGKIEIITNNMTQSNSPYKHKQKAVIPISNDKAPMKKGELLLNSKEKESFLRYLREKQKKSYTQEKSRTRAQRVQKNINKKPAKETSLDDIARSLGID